MESTKAITDWLPKPVLDRVRRYAREGRELHARYGHEGCLLLACAMGQLPVVVLRTTSREQFAPMCSAALIEWARAAKARITARG